MQKICPNQFIKVSLIMLKYEFCLLVLLKYDQFLLNF